jgi:hypothetical protein
VFRRPEYRCHCPPLLLHRTRLIQYAIRCGQHNPSGDANLGEMQLPFGGFLFRFRNNTPAISANECHNPYHRAMRFISCVVRTGLGIMFFIECQSAFHASGSCSKLTNNLLWQPSGCLRRDSTRAIIYADGYSQAERRTVLEPCISFVGPLWFGNRLSDIIIPRRLSNDPSTVLLLRVMHRTISPFLPDLCLGYSEDSIEDLLDKCNEQQGIVFI